jgi:hypothetical protein
MKFKKQIFIESMVGLFSFAVIAALFMLTVVLSQDALFRSERPMEILFDDAMGLRVGDVVSARGVTVGKVKRIALQEDGVHVMVLLTMPVHLRDDYRIQVLPTSVLGGRYLNIDEGSHDSATLRDPPELLRGSPSPDLISSATATVEDIRKALNDGVLDDFKATMASIRKISARLAEGEGTLGKLLADDAVYGDVQRIAANLGEVSDKLAQGEGTLGKLLNDGQLYADAPGHRRKPEGRQRTPGQGRGHAGAAAEPGRPGVRGSGRHAGGVPPGVRIRRQWRRHARQAAGRRRALSPVPGAAARRARRAGRHAGNLARHDVHQHLFRGILTSGAGRRHDMKTGGKNGTAAALVAALLAATLPAAPARAEIGDDSTGAAITVGLMATVVVVYGLVALRSDVDRYTQADVDQAIAQAAKKADASPLVLQAVTAPVGLPAAGGGATEVAGAAIGWRMSF